jgi:acetyltransferase-like isoleucine patch superfamily enzyme
MHNRVIAIKACIALLINLLFFNCLKIFLYRVLLGYKISYKSKLGLFSFLIVENLQIEPNCRIKAFSLFYDCKFVKLHNGAIIFRFVRIKGAQLVSIGQNTIIGEGTVIEARERDRIANGVIGGGRFIVGPNTTITKKHLFDITSSILIKDHVVIGGSSSLFYTHSFDCFGNFSYGNIVLCRNIYVGANAILLPGIHVNHSIVIGAGAVVAKSLDKSGIYIGNPVRMISDNPLFRRKIIIK